jgi:hypothetical protein
MSTPPAPIQVGTFPQSTLDTWRQAKLRSAAVTRPRRGGTGGVSSRSAAPPTKACGQRHRGRRACGLCRAGHFSTAGPRSWPSGAAAAAHHDAERSRVAVVPTRRRTARTMILYPRPQQACLAIPLAWTGLRQGFCRCWNRWSEEGE